MLRNSYRKFTRIINTAWQRALSYRSTVLAYRIGNTLEFGVQLLLWTAIFGSGNEIKGYTYNEIVSYTLVGWLILYFTVSYGLESHISNEIRRGELSSYLLKPIRYLKYILILSFGRASLSVISGVVMQTIFVFLFRKNIVLTQSIVQFLIGIVIVFIGYFVQLYISILIGFISFWVTDISGIHYTIGIIKKILSGAYFPTNLLPTTFLNVSRFLPFIYIFYFPTQVFLGNVGIQETLIGLGIQIVWLILLVSVTRFVWRMGVRRFESYGI